MTIKKKVVSGADLAASLREQLIANPLWQSAGQEMKVVVDQELSDEEVSGIITFVNQVRQEIHEHGPIVAPESDE